MEASQAGLAGQAAGGEGEGAQQQQGPDVSALAEQLTAMNQGQEELRQFLLSAPWQQQQAEPQGPQEPEALDLSFLDDTDPGFDPQAAAQRLNDLIEQRVQAGIQQAVNPLAEQQAEMRRTQEANDLTSEFPELGDPETAQRVVATSRQYAEMMGQSHLANEPSFWRLVYLAGRAADAANDESPPSGDTAHLEGGGGAGPAASQADLAQLIVGAKKGAGVLPFG